MYQQKWLWVGLVLGVLLGASTQAAQLGSVVALGQSAFCQRTDCKLRSIEPITPDLKIKAVTYLTLWEREDNGYAVPGPLVTVFKQGETAISARLVVTTQDSAFVGSDLSKKGSDTYIAAQFLEAMTGHKPRAATLSAWENTCQSNTPGKSISFAGYKLACVVYQVTDARQLSFLVLKSITHD